MKRSEMLLEIVDILNNSPKSVVNSYIADMILNTLEDKGMLPPPLNRSCYNVIYDEVKCEWEPEDL